MTLSEFIRSIGVVEFARRFAVSERAATSWMYRQRVPRAVIAQRIVAGSPVTWDGIYGTESKSESSHHAAAGTAAGTTTA